MISSRREFIAQSSTILATLPFLNLSCMTSLAPYADTIGLQLYTVRDLMAIQPKETLTALKRMGYKQVELGDTRELKKLLPLCKDLGLAVHSSFMLWTPLTGRWDLMREETPFTYETVLEEAQKAELSHLVFGYMLPQERSTLDDYKKLCDTLNTAGEQAQTAGIQLCYHNHSFEFKPTEGEIPYEILIDRLDNKLVQFELDVFWSTMGGYDSVELFKRISDRTRLLHLKDKKAGIPTIYDESKVPKNAFQPLGKGEVELKMIIDLAVKAGVDYCYVEQDQSPAPMEDVAVSHKYIVR